ncbi:MAG: hypothetical protein L3J73_01380 [Thermoplasmata archaeon]|nr:hypothetical protein [Thermoplasmata archaeon]
MMPARAARPACEAERAYRDLIGRPSSDTRGGANACSPEVPEARDFPAPPPGGSKYILCNGHLRDLFDEQARAAPSAVAARSH